MAPAPRETPKAEDGGSQRIRVGALGLAFVFLLVMLATALLRAAGDAELSNQEAASANVGAPAEPLAQLGVVPGNPATGTTPAPSPAAAPVAARPETAASDPAAPGEPVPAPTPALPKP